MTWPEFQAFVSKKSVDFTSSAGSPCQASHSRVKACLKVSIDEALQFFFIKKLLSGPMKVEKKF